MVTLKNKVRLRAGVTPKKSIKELPKSWKNRSKGMNFPKYVSRKRTLA